MEKPKPLPVPGVQPTPKGMVEVKRVQTPTGKILQEFVRREKRNGQHKKGKS